LEIKTLLQNRTELDAKDQKKKLPTQIEYRQTKKNQIRQKQKAAS